MTWHHLWWIPAIILYNIGYAYVSHQNNLHGGKWIFWTWFYGMFALWFIVSRVSKDIVFDAFIYDSVIALSFAVAIIYMTGVNDFTVYRWIGIGMVIAGLVLMKI